MKKVCVFVAVMVLMVIAGPVRSQESKSLTPDFKGVFFDTAFEQYVNPKLFEECLQSLSPALLTDVALQLAEGERVLLRTCDGLTADQMARFAVEIAKQQGDKVSLERLAKSAKQRGASELAAEIGTFATLTIASRSEDKVAAAIKAIDPKDADRCKEILLFFEGEKFFHSKEELKAALALVDGMMDFSAETKGKLHAILAQEIEAAPEKANPAALALKTLGVPSRQQGSIGLKDNWGNTLQWHYPRTFSGPNAYQAAWNHAHAWGGRFPYEYEFRMHNATLKNNGYGKNSLLNVYWIEEGENQQWSIAFGRLHNNGKNYYGYDEAIRVK